MKINFILPGYPVRPVGGFRVVYELANEMCMRGHELHITHANSLKKAYINRSVLKSLKNELAYLCYTIFNPSIHWVRVNPKITLHYKKDIVENKSVDADVVFATAWQTAEYVRNFPPEKGRKYYLVMDFDPFFAFRETLAETWRYPMRLLCISQWLCDKVKAYSGRDALLLPLGINKTFRKYKGITEREKTVAMMYSSAGYKDAGTGIKVMELCMKNLPGVKCVLFGPKKTRPEGVPASIDYKGSLSDDALAGVYNSAAVFISSSLAEGFAFPPAEAMACGCAVACTDCGGNRDFIENNVNALVSKPGDVEQLYRNTEQLLKDGPLREKIAINGMKSIASFNWTKSADVFERALMNINGPAAF